MTKKSSRLSPTNIRYLVILSSVLFLILQYQLWFSKGGVFTARALEKTIAIQEQQNAALKKRNDALQADINDLKSGDEAAAERARNELGLVKKNETFYQVVTH